MTSPLSKSRDSGCPSPDDKEESGDSLFVEKTTVSQQTLSINIATPDSTMGRKNSSPCPTDNPTHQLAFQGSRFNWDRDNGDWEKTLELPKSSPLQSLGPIQQAAAALALPEKPILSKRALSPIASPASFPLERPPKRIRTPKDLRRDATTRYQNQPEASTSLAAMTNPNPDSTEQDASSPAASQDEPLAITQDPARWSLILTGTTRHVLILIRRSRKEASSFSCSSFSSIQSIPFVLLNKSKRTASEMIFEFPPGAGQSREMCPTSLHL